MGCIVGALGWVWMGRRGETKAREMVRAQKVEVWL